MVFYQQEDSSPNEALGIPEQFKICGMVHLEGEGELSLAGYIEKLMLKEIPALRRSFQVGSFWKLPRLVQRVLRFSEKTVAI